MRGSLSKRFNRFSLNSENSAAPIETVHITYGGEQSGEPQTLEGVISTITQDSLLVRTADGAVYQLQLSSLTVDSEAASIRTGQRAEISYHGTLPVQTASGIPSTEVRARELLRTMGLEEKVGQMFFVRCPADNPLPDIAAYHPGGYILFANFFENRTKDEAYHQLKACQDASRIPLLTGVDEEGGTVNRVSKFRQYRAVPFWSPQDLFKEGGLSSASDCEDKAQLLRAVGVNINFAPVCDVSTNAADYMFKRSIGQNAVKTSKYVETVVSATQENGVGCVLKHFPGYGSNGDTHTGIVHDSRSLESFRQSDFLPFEAGIRAGAGAILVSHNIVECLDADVPASLSPAVHKLLRENFAFTGVILTDDLSMKAITAYRTALAPRQNHSGRQRHAALHRLCQSDPGCLAAVQRRLVHCRIEESVMRILLWKLELGII
ncbi:MAG: glycoside hydrolase family 3 N-terminal domain-containing protein [Oscillospiraceae bacterium]